MDPGLVEITVSPGTDIPTEEEFVEILRNSGVDSAKRILRNAEGRHPHLDVIDQRPLNQFGYGYLNRCLPDLAVTVFQLNTAAHPRSANTFDSLGEAYLAAGDTAQAIYSRWSESSNCFLLTTAFHLMQRGGYDAGFL